MKKISNKTILTIFALVLSLSVTLGVSLAYFSDYEEAAGGATLNLGGKTELTEGNYEDKKDIVIANTGKTNMIVRVAIFAPDGMQPVNPAGGWVDGGDGFYYYNQVLEPEETTGIGKLVAEMKWKDGEQAPDYNFDVTVVHESAQAVYNGGTLVAPDGWDKEAVAGIAIPQLTGKGVN